MTENAGQLETRAARPGRRPTRSGVAAVALILFAVFGAAPGLAAEADTAAPRGETEATNGNGADETGRPEASAGKQAAEREADEEGGFTPSEEISEDFAVSFPVDI